MIDPSTTAVGDWVASLNGISQVLKFVPKQRVRPIEDADETGEFVEKTDEYYVCLKTFCNYDKKPKLPRYMAETCSPTLCDRIEETDYASWIEEFSSLSPKRWAEFQGITEAKLGEVFSAHGGLDLLPDLEAIERQISLIQQTLKFPDGGLTLNQIHRLLIDADIGFDLLTSPRIGQERGGVPQSEWPFTLYLNCKGYHLSDEGLPLYFEAELFRNKEVFGE